MERRPVKPELQEFLTCCRTQTIKSVRLIDDSLIVNPASGDFGGVVFEFDVDSYLIKADLILETKEDYIAELQAKKITSLDGIKDDVHRLKVFKTLSSEQHGFTFLTELINEEGYIDGLEFKAEQFYIFMIANGFRDIIVTASAHEYIKYESYSHQFGYVPCEWDEGYINLLF